MLRHTSSVQLFTPASTYSPPPARNSPRKRIVSTYPPVQPKTIPSHKSQNRFCAHRRNRPRGASPRFQKQPTQSIAIVRASGCNTVSMM
jgi:hypothetical protein